MYNSGTCVSLNEVIRPNSRRLPLAVCETWSDLSVEQKVRMSSPRLSFNDGVITIPRWNFACIFTRGD